MNFSDGDRRTSAVVPQPHRARDRVRVWRRARKRRIIADNDVAGVILSPATRERDERARERERERERKGEKEHCTKLQIDTIRVDAVISLVSAL